MTPAQKRIAKANALDAARNAPAIGASLIACLPPAASALSLALIGEAPTGDECRNEEWVAENPGHTIEWARGMWWCECPKCEAPTGDAKVISLPVRGTSDGAA